MNSKQAQNRTHTIHINSDKTSCSKSELLHNFIANLSFKNYNIKRVSIFEVPIGAEIVFQENKPSLSLARARFSPFKQKGPKAHHEFTLHLKINERDMAGRNYALDYRFDGIKIPIQKVGFKWTEILNPF